MFSVGPIIAGVVISVVALLWWAVRRFESKSNLERYHEEMLTAAYTRDNPTVAFHVRKGDGTLRNVSIHRS